MPLYEYRCPECGHRFEILQRLGAGAEDVICPGCGREKPEKQFSTFASSAASSGGAMAESAGGGGCGGGGGGFT